MPEAAGWGVAVAEGDGLVVAVVTEDIAFGEDATVEIAGQVFECGQSLRWVDNVFVERLWRSVKYEDIYLHPYDTPAALRVGLGRYFTFYNTRRRHSALGRRTPDAVYHAQVVLPLAA